MSLFTENDVRLLDKTLVIREQLIDNLQKNEFPTKPRDIDAYVNLLESVDRSILAKAKIKVDESSNKINEESRQLLKDLLIELHTSPTSMNFTIEGKLESLEKIPEYQSLDIEINPGELIPHSDNIDIKKLMISQS